MRKKIYNSYKSRFTLIELLVASPMSLSNEELCGIKHPQRHIAIKKAFTLIELLVVIAIIGILASMLLPALQNARDSAKTMVCMSNQKQGGLAVFNYANDYTGFEPPLRVNGNSWTTTLLNLNYLGTKKSFDDFTHNPQPFVPLCPIFDPFLYGAKSKWNNSTDSGATYGLLITRKIGGQYINMSDVNPSLNATDWMLGAYNILKFPNPSGISVFADSVGTSDSNTVLRGQTYYVYNWAGNRFFHSRHPGYTCNIFFADGHVDNISSGKIPGYHVQHIKRAGLVIPGI